MKFNLKIIILLLLVSISVSALSVGIVLFSFTKDKKESVFQNQTIATINFAQNISKYLSYLKLAIKSPDREQLKAFPDVLEIKLLNEKTMSMKQIPEVTVTKLYLVLKLKVKKQTYHVTLKKGFLSQFTHYNSRVGVGLFSIIQNRIFDINHYGNKFVIPDTEFLTKVLNSKNKHALMAKKVQKDNGEVLISMAAISGLNTTFLMMQTPQDDINVLMKKAISNWSIWIVLIFVLIVAIGITVSSSITRPLTLLIEATKKISKGERDIKFKKITHDEFGELANSLSIMGKELKDQDDELILINKKLIQKEKLASLGMFSAGVAHEVKNPLGGILANAQLVQRKTQNEDIIRYTDLIIKESYRASGIVQDLLSFSKEKQIFRETLRFDDLANHLLLAQGPVLENMGISFQVVPSEVSLFVDRDGLFQVLENLVLNSADANPKNVKLFIKDSKNNITINVVDDGDGMDTDTVNRIFEPFYTTKSGKNGTGLGMAICYGIIQQHNGFIEIESSPGNGAIIQVVFPK